MREIEAGDVYLLLNEETKKPLLLDKITFISRKTGEISIIYLECAVGSGIEITTTTSNESYKRADKRLLWANTGHNIQIRLKGTE